MYENHVEDIRVQKVIPITEYMMKVHSIRDTVKSLEHSLIISRRLEAEHWLRYSSLKTENKVMMDDLKKANKRNKNMLSMREYLHFERREAGLTRERDIIFPDLFRHSVTDFRLGSEIALPEPLRREVQRTWHQKYDALLSKNEQLKRDLDAASLNLREKAQEINDLQQKLLTLGDRLVERNEAIQSICNKYLTLKKRKDEQEILLRGCIEMLQNELK